MTGNNPKNTASLSQLGNLYQYLIALKICIESADGAIVNIEKFGDLTTEDYNYEIKHHANPAYTLNETHIDFWKSLSNWVNNRDLLSSHSKFILLTSAIVNDDSSFKNWNQSEPEEKFTVISGILEAINNSKHEYKTIKPYLNRVFGFNDSYTKKDLLVVLEKLIIKHSFENAEGLYSNLLDHPAFLFARDNKKPALIRSLIGFIVEKGVYSPSEWDIEVNEFREFLREQARKSVNNEVLDFPDIKIDTEIDTETYEKDFIKKIADIPYPEKVSEAAENYTYTQNVLLVMAERTPHVLEEFSKQVNEAGIQLSNMKEIICLEIEDIDAKKLIKKSKILYNKASLEIKTGQNVPSNIQKGIIHTHTDQSDFYWKIKEVDVED
jgi:hypothetical protein